MDIEMGHLLSLIQRNQEVARTALDSADEFTRQLIRKMSEQPAKVTRAQTIEVEKMPLLAPPNGHKPKAPSAKVSRRLPAGQTIVGQVREYLAQVGAQLEGFKPKDVMAWIKHEKHVAIPLKRIGNVLGIAVRNGELARKGKGIFAVK